MIVGNVVGETDVVGSNEIVGAAEGPVEGTNAAAVGGEDKEPDAVGTVGTASSGGVAEGSRDDAVGTVETGVETGDA